MIFFLFLISGLQHRGYWGLEEGITGAVWSQQRRQDQQKWTDHVTIVLRSSSSKCHWSSKVNTCKTNTEHFFLACFWSTWACNSKPLACIVLEPPYIFFLFLLFFFFFFFFKYNAHALNYVEFLTLEKEEEKEEEEKKKKEND